ncbi:hypothetical protein MUP46_03545 [Patescibacteria group bacterium]|nr:hypothetical protein [Patescibacteria group bacterium]
MSEQINYDEVQRGIELTKAATARAWLELPRIQETARKLGFDVDKVTLGCVVNEITADDGNAFGPTISMGDNFKPERAIVGKQRLFARLDWESGMDVVPEDIRNRLKSVRDKLGKIDWTTYEGFSEAYGIWNKEVMGFVLEQIKNNPKIKEACDAVNELDEAVENGQMLQ